MPRASDFSRRLTRRLALVPVIMALPAMASAQSASVDSARDTVRLTVDEAVAIALRQSDELGVASALVDVADAQYGVARANALPQLRVTGAYLHVYESARGQAVGAVFNQPNTYTANANLSQTLFQGGRLLAAARAGNVLRQAARFDEREQRANITLLVQRAYLQALFVDRIAVLQQQNLALATSRVTQVEQFERAGQAARYDVLRARVERANI